MIRRPPRKESVAFPAAPGIFVRLQSGEFWSSHENGARIQPSPIRGWRLHIAVPEEENENLGSNAQQPHIQRPIPPAHQRSDRSRTRVGAHSKFSNLGRHIGETGVQKFDAAGPGSGVAWAKLAVPEKGGIGFPTEQRIVGSLAAVARVVADLGAILMAKDGHDRAVEIEDESGAPFGLMNEMLQQSIVDTVQLLPKTGRCLKQKSAQSLRIREAR